MELFATCDAGLEAVLAEELSRLGAEEPTPATRGVAFRGDAAVLARANLGSRLATRVLLRLSTFDARNRSQLYEAAAEVDWGRWVGRGSTIRVDARGRTPDLTSTAFVAQVVKDAVCDRLRGERGERPSVDRRAPDVPIGVHIGQGGRCTVSLDSSGERLHRRGYRLEGGEAPLRETLAAGVLALAGFDGARPLLDPMCGSGTFIVEAALAARRIPPGRSRLGPGGAGFAFQRWPGHDPSLLAAVARDLDAAALPAAGAPLVGSDEDPRAVAVARRNAVRAGVDGDVVILRRPLARAEPRGEGGLVVTNPPYGARLGDAKALAGLYRELGDVLKKRFAGHEAWVLTGDLRLARSIGLRPTRRIELWNGPIECRLLRFALYEGSRRGRGDGG